MSTLFSRNDGKRYVNRSILILDNCTKEKGGEKRSQSTGDINNKHFTDEMMLEMTLEDKVGAARKRKELGRKDWGQQERARGLGQSVTCAQSTEERKSRKSGEM